MDTIGTRIRTTREARSMTASDLARLAGVTPTAVWNWENSGTQPQVKALQSLSTVLHVSKNWLLTGIDDGPTEGPVPSPPDLSSYPLEDLLNAIDRKGFAVTVAPKAS